MAKEKTLASIFPVRYAGKKISSERRVIDMIRQRVTQFSRTPPQPQVLNGVEIKLKRR